MDDELGPAEGEFRVWLDLALARGYRVTWLKGAYHADITTREHRPIYTVQDTTTGRQDAVWSAKGVRSFFDYIDTYVKRRASQDTVPAIVNYRT